MPTFHPTSALGSSRLGVPDTNSETTQALLEVFVGAARVPGWLAVRGVEKSRKPVVAIPTRSFEGLAVLENPGSSDVAIPPYSFLAVPPSD